MSRRYVVAVGIVAALWAGIALFAGWRIAIGCMMIAILAGLAILTVPDRRR